MCIYSSSQGKPEIAVPFCKKAVHELKQKKGSEDPDVAAMLNILAVIYRYRLYNECTEPLQWGTGRQEWSYTIETNIYIHNLYTGTYM